jgi:hypothetical protein
MCSGQSGLPVSNSCIIAGLSAWVTELLFLEMFIVLYIITVFKEFAMTPRIICPHCHCPIDPQSLETAVGAGVCYRICPECDEPIVLSADRREEDPALPLAGDSPRCVREEHEEAVPERGRTYV